MVVPYKGSYLTVNPNAHLNFHFCLEKRSEERRNLFKKGIFQVKEDEYGFQLFVNGRYAGGWIKNNSAGAESVIHVAFNVYQAMGGA